MRIEFLGTGGAITTPKPGCDCRVCLEARQFGVPYSRTGPSVFVHGPNVLIDTPEEIKYQLNRSAVGRIDACFYSHWHPDHTMGRRVWEMNKDWRGWPRRNRCTDIYLPPQVGADFRNRLGIWEHLRFFEEAGLVRLNVLSDGESVEVNDAIVTPIQLAESYAYGFLFHAIGRRVFIAPDELLGWDPPRELHGVDLAVVPMGIVEHDPVTKERRIHPEHQVLKYEATFQQALDIVARIEAARVVMTHIEEPDGLSHDDLQRLSDRLKADGLPISFAYDTLIVDV